MLDKIKIYLTTESGIYTALFSILALSEQIYNGLYGSKFSITDLMTIYAFIVTNLNIQHGINSKYNSEMGVKP